MTLCYENECAKGMVGHVPATGQHTREERIKTC